MDYKFNPAINLFKPENIVRHIQEYAKYYNYPTIISIGSGTAHIEHMATDYDNNINWICIDPDPTSYSEGEVYIKPLYSNIDQLIETQPELVNNCHLFINWAPPIENTDNETPYDYDAIIKLKPISFMVIYESYYEDDSELNGGGGSKSWFDYIQNTNEYTLLHKTLVKLENIYDSDDDECGYSEFDPKIGWWQKSSLNTNNSIHLPNFVTISHRPNSCILF
jgi:hypothetical protein